MPENDPYRRALPRFELPLETIKLLEQQTCKQLRELVEPIEPSIYFSPYDVVRNDLYGMGGMEATGYIAMNHMLTTEIWAGRQNGQNVQYIRLRPLTADDFDTTYDEAVTEHRQGRLMFEPTDAAKYRQLHAFIGQSQTLFKDHFNTPSLGFQTRQADEFRHYRDHKQTYGIDFLNADPYAYHHTITVDLNGADAVRQLRMLQGALHCFADESAALTGTYQDLKAVYNVTNKFNL